MIDIFEYKRLYLSSNSFYQFIYLDDNFCIKDSCNSLFDFSERIGQPLWLFFPFLEPIQAVVTSEPNFFLPHIDFSNIDNSENSQVLDFSFFKENRFQETLIVCIIKDVSKTNNDTLEMHQKARMAMIENEYLALQNKNIHLENALLQMRNKELQTSKELKNLFFSKISHELRSPVNGILGLSQIILQQENPNTELKNYIESIYTASRHLRIILDDILDLSKLESGKIALQRNPFTLNAVLQHLRLNFLRILEQKQLFLQIQIASDVPSTLIGDEVRFTQILYNLISNSIKFTQKGGITINVFLLDNTSSSHCRLNFVVEDTGEGMTADELQKIFNPYEQVGSMSYQILGGTGLGLSVVKQLVEIQGGNISVSSQKGIGTQFKIELPFEFQANVAESILHDSHQFIALSALIVDDSLISQLYTQKILSNWGFEVDCCDTGSKGLQMLQEKYYDLLITDIKIPDLEGDVMVENFEKLNPHQQKTSIIFATGSVGLRKFKYTTLLKPFSPEQLWDIINQSISSEKTSLYGTDYLLKITDNKTSFLKDMIDAFLVACPEDMNSVENNAQNRNTEGLYKAVHKIKPMAQLMGSNVLVRILERIESLCRQENANWEMIDRYVLDAKKVGELACKFFEKQKNEL